jgi:transcriptional regulator with XRE-family HTH domain
MPVNIVDMASTERARVPERGQIHGARLHRRRAQLGISQHALAIAAGYESQSTISVMETGTHKNPSTAHLVAIARELRCSVDWLLGAGPDDLYEHGDLSDTFEAMLPWMLEFTDADWRKVIEMIEAIRTPN